MTTFVWQYNNTTAVIEADTAQEAREELADRIERARAELKIDVGSVVNFDLIARC